MHCPSKTKGSIMKRTAIPTATRVGLTAALAIGMVGFTAPIVANAVPTTYYVATTGADNNAGTSAAPFKTIQKCATVAVAGDTCLINAGTYRETVKPTNSGTAGNPITFKPVVGATVKVDGTDAVSGWTLDTGNIYKTAVALSGTAAAPYSSTEYPSNTTLWANQVFAGTAMVPEAAYPAPSTNPFTQTYITSGSTTTRSASGDCDTPPCTQMLTGTLTYNTFPAFGNMTGVQAYFTGGWVALSAAVTSGTLTTTKHTLNITFPKSDDNVYPGGGNAKNFRLVGSKAFLTGPGQWYYDAGAQQLYMWATGGGTPTNVYVKKRNYSFDLTSRSFINVTGITTFANSITTNDATSGVVLDGINASYLSHWQTAQYVTSLPLAGIYDANHRYDSGILLHGTNNTLKNSTIVFSSGNGVNLKGSGHTVTNNYIHDVSYNGTYTAAVTLEVGSHDDDITHNSLYNTGRDVINMNTNLYPNDGYKNIDISYNDISGYAKISYDLGGIYVCCDTSLDGTRIHHNRIHDPANTGNGLHFDNGAYDVTVDHNLIYGLKGVGDISHGGNGINFGGHTNRPPAGSNLPYLTGRFYNNTIVTGDNYTIYNYFASAGYVANTIVKNNILDGASPAGQNYGYIAGGVPQQSNNLVTKLSSDGTGTDPLYTSPTTGNYTLQAGSTAVNAGTPIAGITDGFAGTAPDNGAFEGSVTWAAGCTLTGCPAIPGGGVTAPPAGVFSLLAKHSTKALSIDATTSQAEQKTLTTATDQQWTVSDAGGGLSKIVNVASGKCLDVNGSSTTNNAAIIAATCSTSASQKFTLQDAGAGFWRIIASHSSKCVDVAGASQAEDAPINQYTCGTANNQQWDFEPASGGATPTNVALGKPTTAYYTATAATRKPANLVDGVYANASNGWYSDGATAGSFSDGDTTSTNGSLCSWVYVDLGQDYTISSFKLQFGETTVAGMWDAPYAVQTLTAAEAAASSTALRNSSVCTRLTGGNFGSIATGSVAAGDPYVVTSANDIWNTVATGTGTNVATSYPLSSPTTARYVRILTNEPTTAHRYGVDIIELEVMGTP